MQLLLAFSCARSHYNHDNWYPSIVADKGLQNQYDTAVLEMYILNSGTNCDCFARSNNSDSTNLLELDLKLEDLRFKNDTVIFIFNFIKINTHLDTVTFYPISNGVWTECMYNGISFKGRGLTPFPLTLGDVEISGIIQEDKEGRLKKVYECANALKISRTLDKFIHK